MRIVRRLPGNIWAGLGRDKGKERTKMKKFHPAATPKLSSTNLPAKRTNGDVIGMNVTISESALLTERITVHLLELISAFRCECR
jgi:hypothetical protein